MPVVGTSNDIATTEQLAAALGQTFSAAQEIAAAQALDTAAAAIRRHTGQHITLVEDDVAVLQGTWARELVLPQWPVVSVSAVMLNGFTVATGTWILSGGGKLYRGNLPIFNGPDDWGGDLFLSSWLGPMASVSVTYTHGFDPCPADVTGICLAAAGRLLTNPAGLKGETIGDYSYVGGDAVQGILTEGEMALLDRYSREP